jgi:hypothetical protein
MNAFPGPTYESTIGKMRLELVAAIRKHQVNPDSGMNLRGRLTYRSNPSLILEPIPPGRSSARYCGMPYKKFVCDDKLLRLIP